MGRSTREIRTRIGLTARGAAFLATGLTLAGLGTVAGVVPAVEFGVLVAALPVATAALTRGPHRGLQVSRTLSAHELASRDLLRVTVGVRGRFPRARSLLVEDRACPALGGPHRFAINGMTGQALSRPHYQLRVEARGVHHIGPMSLHVIDRFGMVHRVTTARGRDEVLVTPPVVPLDPAVLSGGARSTGSGTLGALGGAADDVIPREYRPGDEMRRIDWKASARMGSLMVRSEESPWRSAITLVLDLQEADHRGREPHSSVDAALSLAASVGCLALESGWDLAVRTSDDVPVFTGSPMSGVEPERHALLRALATVPVSRSTVPSTTLRHTEIATTGPLVLIVGAMPPASARLLLGLGAHSPQRMLLAVAADDWQADGPADPGALRSAAATDAAVSMFADAGWRTSRLRRNAGVAAAWSGLLT